MKRARAAARAGPKRARSEAARTRLKPEAPTSSSLPLGTALLTSDAKWATLFVGDIDMGSPESLCLSRPAPQRARAARDDARDESPPVYVVLAFFTLMSSISALAASGALSHGFEGQASHQGNDAVAFVLSWVLLAAMRVATCSGCEPLLVAVVTVVSLSVRAIIARFGARPQRPLCFHTKSREVSFVLPLDAKVSDLKKHLYQRTQLDDTNFPDGASEDLCAAFILMFNRKPLQDHESLAASGIRPGAEIQVQVRQPICKTGALPCSCSLDFPVAYLSTLALFNFLLVVSHICKSELSLANSVGVCLVAENVESDFRV